MKKAVSLIFCLWAMAGIGMAQDIYTCGSFVNAFGQKGSGVFKNEIIVFSRTETGKELFSSAMAMDTLTGDIYWSSNSNPIGNIANGYGCVMKNAEVLLDNVIGTRINDISFDGNDIYNAMGQLVMTAVAEPNKMIKVAQLPSGLYMIRCGNQVSRFNKE